MKNKNLIIQAGGKGTRLKHLTQNVPKCLVPVSGKTLFSRIVDRFGSDHNIFFIVDHLSEVVVSYRDTFFREVTIIKTSDIGTCSGISCALDKIPAGQNVKISWSDLLFEENLIFDETKNTIGLSQTFDCRYQYIDNQIIKETSNRAGIAGFFSFACKSILEDVPSSGSFVGKWLRITKNIDFSELTLNGVHEIGTLDLIAEYESKSEKSRFFNQVVIDGSKVTKSSKDEAYNSMIENEFMWYTYPKFNSLSFIPKNVEMIEKNTLVMENLGESAASIFPTYSRYQKEEFLIKVMNRIQQIHDLDKCKFNKYDNFKLYVQKVFDRTFPYEKMLKHFHKPVMKINNKIMINPFQGFESFSQELVKIGNPNWTVVHGDITLSNILISSDGNISLIDPRATLGSGFSMFGDPIYDFAKLYYSIVDGYDSVNTRKFRVSYDKENIEIEDFFDSQIDNIFFQHCKYSKREILSRLYGIWFSLIGWVSEDIDAMNYAFFKGVIAYNEYVKSCEPRIDPQLVKKLYGV